MFTVESIGDTRWQVVREDGDHWGEYNELEKAEHVKELLNRDDECDDTDLYGEDECQ